MDGWRPGCAAMGQAACLPPSQPLRHRHRGSSWSSGSQPPRVRHSAKPFKHTHPHHEPRPLSKKLLSAHGRVGSARQSWFLVRMHCHYPIHTPTATWQTESPDSTMLSFTFTLTWVKATGTQSCAGLHCGPTPVVTASLQYRPGRNGPINPNKQGNGTVVALLLPRLLCCWGGKTVQCRSINLHPALMSGSHALAYPEKRSDKIRTEWWR